MFEIVTGIIIILLVLSISIYSVISFGHGGK